MGARSLKAFSVLFLALAAASLLLVHGVTYEPAVSFVLLYLAVCVGVTVAVALVLWPAAQFTEGFCGWMYALYAAVLAMMVFFSGGVTSELYVLFFPLLLAVALHGTRGVVLVALVSILSCYALAMLPGLVDDGAEETVALIFYRFGALALTGVFALAVARSAAPGGVSDADDEGYATDEDGSLLLEQVEGELAARRGVPVAVVLVDPGEGVEDLEVLLERVWARIGEPILLGDGDLFGLVLSGMDDRGVEGAARRALAAASSLGAKETRAGAAIYPRDARNAEDLLSAAGQALEAAFEVESPSAIVLAGRSTPRPEGDYRAAR